MRLTRPFSAPSLVKTRLPVTISTVGCFQYLNTLPLHFGLHHVPLQLAEPATLNAAMLNGTLQVSGVSASFYQQHTQRFVLLPKGPSISAFGAVLSVLFLYSPHQLPTLLTGQVPVWVPQASASSVAVLRWWLAQQAPAFGLCKKAVASQLVVNAFPTGQGLASLHAHGNALLIGDKALLLYEQIAAGASNYEDLKVLDLAEVWTQAHPGLPMVFGVWVAQAEWAKQHPQRLNQLSQAFLEQAQLNLNEASRLTAMVKKAQEQYPQLSQKTLLHYWQQSLDFSWSDAHAKSLALLL
jgi:predicted solute-binding protein